MDRALVAALLLASCSAPPTWSLWESHETWNRTSSLEAPADRVQTQKIESGLDRAACELVVDRKARELRSTLAGVAAAKPTGDGAVYMRDGAITSSRFVCLKSGEEPSTARRAP